MKNLGNKSILVTGGTGSFGKAFIRRLLTDYPDIGRLAVYSRDELKQFDMQQEFPVSKYPGIRYFLGDVRDYDRLKFALNDIDIVVHAAALKQVPAAEYNPFEFIKTNIMGAQNIVQACLESNVKNVVALSTDKAAAPINLYGATKLCSDKIFTAANKMKGKKDIKFSVVRYGNVMGSRGSVIPFFIEQAKSNNLTITHKDMTRFNITLEEGVETVLWALLNCEGGEVIVPKIPSYKITDVATAVAPNANISIIGIRPGEKLHESMITVDDSLNTIDLGSYYAILPAYRLEEEGINKKYKFMQENFSYISSHNKNFLTVEELRALIKKHIDPTFKEQ